MIRPWFVSLKVVTPRSMLPVDRTSDDARRKQEALHRLDILKKRLERVDDIRKGLPPPRPPWNMGSPGLIRYESLPRGEEYFGVLCLIYCTVVGSWWLLFSAVGRGGLAVYLAVWFAGLVWLWRTPLLADTTGRFGAGMPPLLVCRGHWINVWIFVPFLTSLSVFSQH